MRGARDARRCDEASIVRPFFKCLETWRVGSGISPTRAAFSSQCDADGIVFEVDRTDLIRRTGHDLLRRQNVAPDEPADGVIGHAELRRGFAHGKPFAVLLGGTVCVHAVDLADGADAVRCPGLSLSGTDARPPG